MHNKAILVRLTFDALVKVELKRIEIALFFS